MIGIQLTWFVADTFLTNVNFTAESPCTRQRTQCKDKSDRWGVAPGLKQEYNQFTDIIDSEVGCIGWLILLISYVGIHWYPTPNISDIEIGWLRKLAILAAAETCSWPNLDREWCGKGTLADSEDSPQLGPSSHRAQRAFAGGTSETFSQVSARWRQ